MVQIQELVTTFQQLSLPEQKSILDMLQRTYRESAKLERLVDLGVRYPGEWLAVVIPAGEDRYTPERGYLLAHHQERTIIWQEIEARAAHKDVFVFFTGPVVAKGFEVTFHDTADSPEVATPVE